MIIQDFIEANKAGFDVKDFRGGMSRNVFADRATISEIITGGKK